MLKFGNKEFRNIQEQVLENMQNIANLKEGTAVLDEFGIKVVGEVDSLQDLSSVADYKLAHDDWAYGDAFAIGTQPPYKLVILTRANDEIAADHWFDIGSFPMPGPKGDTGDQGEPGPQGPVGDKGDTGAAAGFGSVLATAQTLPAGSSATATVVTSGSNTAKEFSFTFGIPRGADGSNASWGNIQGNLSSQTDLKNALDDKQDELVSGTNIKTINNQSVIGSGNIEINSGVWGNITGDISNQSDLQTALNAKANTASLATVASSGSYNDLSNKPTIGNGTITIKKNGETIDSFGLNQTASQNINIIVPTKASDLTNDSGFISGVAWGEITGTLSNQTDLSSALANKQSTISDLETIRSGAAAGATAVQPTTLQTELATKQDVISDLGTIRSGAVAGATAVQPTAIADMATKTWVSQKDYATSTALTNGLATKQDVISDLADIRSGAEAGAISVSPLTLSVELDKKQDVISDLENIRLGADIARTAVQPAALSEYAKTSELATVATSGIYDDLLHKPVLPVFDYKSDVIKDSSDVVRTIYGGSHTKFTNAGTPGTIIGNTVDVSLPPLTWGTYGSYTEYAYDEAITVEECYKCWKTYIDVHNLSIDNEINLKLSYTNSNGETITAVGTGTIHSHSMIDPSLPKHQIRLANVSFPDLNISNATFRIQPQYGQIFITGNQLTDSAGQPITNITISINITEENVYKTINSNFIGADIARTADIQTAISSMTRETWTFTLSDGTTTTKTIVTDDSAN